MHLITIPETLLWQYLIAAVFRNLYISSENDETFIDHCVRALPILPNVYSKPNEH